MPRTKALLASAALVAFSMPSHAADARLQDVLSAVTINLTNDGQFNRALLVQDDEDNAGLMIFMPQPEANASSSHALTLAFQKPKLVFAGSAWGQQPTLSVGSQGSLVVSSENIGIGRSRWEQKLTIVYRSKEFLVAGVTYDTRDTIDLKDVHHCDVNLLSGTAVRDGKSVRGTPRTLRVADWSDDTMPKECRF